MVEKTAVHIYTAPYALHSLRLHRVHRAFLEGRRRRRGNRYSYGLNRREALRSEGVFQYGRSFRLDLGDYRLKHPSGKDFCKDIDISFEPKGDILMDIRLDNISKSFGDKKVLTNLSAVIKKGKVTCIMGPSGCGKTTLLNIMAGLLTPDEGNITGIPERKSAVFQEERLCETFGAISNVRIVCGKNVKIETIKEHLNRIGLGDSMNKPVNG